MAAAINLSSTLPVVTPDVNVVVAAFRNDQVHHRTALRWLEQCQRKCARGLHALVLLEVVVVGFIDVVTDPKVFAKPETIDDAVAFIDAVLSSSGVEMRFARDTWLFPGNKLLEKRISSNKTTDIRIAATVESLGENLVAFDRDFVNLLPSRSVAHPRCRVVIASKDEAMLR